MKPNSSSFHPARFHGGRRTSAALLLAGAALALLAAGCTSPAGLGIAHDGHSAHGEHGGPVGPYTPHWDGMAGRGMP